MQTQTEVKRPLHPASMTKRALQGAAIALVLIIVFLVSAGEGNPAWPKFWMIKPLLIVPAAGAVGGICYYYMDSLRQKGTWPMVFANIASLVIYIVGLWMGSVLGLNGTYWN